MVLLCAVLLFYYCYCAKIIAEAAVETIVEPMIILFTEKMLIAIVTNVMTIAIGVMTIVINVMTVGGKKIKIADALYMKNVLARKNLRLWKEKISGPLIKIRHQGKIAGNRIKTIQKSILL